MVCQFIKGLFGRFAGIFQSLLFERSKLIASFHQLRQDQFVLLLQLYNGLRESQRVDIFFESVGLHGSDKLSQDTRFLSQSPFAADVARVNLLFNSHGSFVFRQVGEGCASQYEEFKPRVQPVAHQVCRSDFLRAVTFPRNRQEFEFRFHSLVKLAQIGLQFRVFATVTLYLFLHVRHQCIVRTISHSIKLIGGNFRKFNFIVHLVILFFLPDTLSFVSWREVSERSE